jgi:hypothetical protein
LDHVVATRTVGERGEMKRGIPSAGKEGSFGPEKGCKHIKDPKGVICIL